MTTSSTTRVWDLPLRLFHTLFAFSLTAALLIGFLGDEDTPLFPYHKLFGLSALLLLAARILMGWIGGRHARWTGLLFAPARLLRHLRELPGRRVPGEAGHNPLAAWVYLLIFGLVTGTVLTGLSMGQSERFEELHELLALGLVFAIILHFAGQALHTIRFGEWVSLSMYHGRKRADPSEAAPPARAAGILITVTLLLLAMMWTSYDRHQQTVRLPGTGLLIQLGEEGHQINEQEKDEHHGHGDHDD